AGAGPAGSTAAALLAREGRRVVLVEKERFPRYHIGESLLPGVLPFLDELGVREQVEALGFHRKTGQTFVWGRDRTPWRLDFGELDAYPYAYFVERADFDRALLENARRLGATVLEGHALERFTDEDGRLAGAQVRGPEGELSIRARYTIDASGQSALIGRRLRLRRFQRRLKNLAVWSYWKGASHLPAPQDEHIFTISIAEGWIWLIPLRDGVTSAGIVTHSWGKKASDADLAPWYLRTLESCEPAWELLRGAERTEPVRAQRDWSYRCARFHGPGWLLAGDAACFVDPILSTGVNLAMNGGYLAALAVHSALDEPANEAAFLRYFQTAYRTLFAEQLESIKHFYRVEARRDSIYWKSKQLLRADLKLDGSLAFMLLSSGLARHATARDPHDVPSQTRSLLASHLDAPSSERASRPEP
ncbi:MAG: tryptophan 7-halogenase, partial [Sandaracinaceae bacterium]|nr:tryptophan 7-halogenase [Sandaracinaceae bacterium]